MSFKSVDFSQLGGLYVYQDTLEFLQNAYSQAIAAIASSYGESVIVSGLVVNGSNVSDGWVVLNGDLMPVVGGAVMSYLFLQEVVTPEQYDDGVQRNVYSTRRLLFTANGDNNYSFADFVRLPFATTSLKDALQTVQSLFNKLLFDEPVIVSGCIVGSNNTVGTGLVYIGGKLLSTVGYNGAANPVYLNSAGVYVTAQPAAPFIKFDGGTSQYYRDVLKRNTAYTGQVVMHTNASELYYFDVNTGLGKWRWLGWKISESLRSRVPLGYDNRTAQPVGADNEAWDATYNTVGNTGGEKKHALSINEMPAHTFLTVTNNDGTDANRLDAAAESIAKKGTFGNNGDYELTAGSGVPTIGKTNSVGGDQKHENRMPYDVVLMFEKL